MSQRDNGYNGGVQNGTSATTEYSRDTEKALREIVERHFKQVEGLKWIPGLSAKELEVLLGFQNPSGLISGLSPDGGIWTKNGIPVIAAEAKKQGVGGNAIERWYKNWSTLRTVNPDILYLTFCRGEGFYHNNSAERILFTAIAVEHINKEIKPDFSNIWNTHYGKTRIYREIEGEAFEDTIYSAVNSAIASIK